MKQVHKRDGRNKGNAQVENRLRQGCRGSAGLVQAHSWSSDLLMRFHGTPVHDRVPNLH